MTGKSLRIRRLTVSLLLCGLLCACGRVRYSFPVLSGTELSQQEMDAGAQLSGPAAVYTQAGDVLRIQSVYKLTEALYGLVMDPPAASVMDVYTLVRTSMEAGTPVLVLYLDGFGWDSFQNALSQARLPHLGTLNAQAALALYPTITPVNYAGMVTGQPPAVNGVTARGIHDLACESIFDLATSLGLRSCIVEGDAQILRFSVEQQLHPDLNGDGDTDLEVFETALQAAESGEFDLLFVHFHGIDDVSHANGPDAQATLDKIAQTDAWAGQLMEAWAGRIIVISDHGQHENDGSGDPEYAGKLGEHGAFRRSDLFVPLLTN